MLRYALATYAHADGARPALVLEDALLDLARCWQRARGAALPHYLNGIDAMLARWDLAEPALAELVQVAATTSSDAALDPATRLLAPFRPARIFGAASNYTE